MFNWAMRRLLSVDRDAAKYIFKAPDDGVKWTISGYTFASYLGDVKKGGEEGVDLIDSFFWPGHCADAYWADIGGKEPEIYSRRAKLGALKVLVCLPYLAYRGWRISKGKK